MAFHDATSYPGFHLSLSGGDNSIVGVSGNLITMSRLGSGAADGYQDPLTFSFDGDGTTYIVNAIRWTVIRLAKGGGEIRAAQVSMLNVACGFTTDQVVEGDTLGIPIDACPSTRIIGFGNNNGDRPYNCDIAVHLEFDTDAIPVSAFWTNLIGTREIV